MDERVVPLQTEGEEAPERDSEDADWELAWRRMRLFPDLCGCSWIVSCPCFAFTAFGTFIWLHEFLSERFPYEETFFRFLAAFGAIVSLFSVGFTLYACVSRRPLPCWRPRWRCVARFVVLCVFVTDLLLLAFSQYDSWQWHDFDCKKYAIKWEQWCEEQKVESHCIKYAITIEPSCESGKTEAEHMASVTKVFGVFVLSIGVALVVVNQRGTREFRRQREELKNVRIRWVKVESFKKWREEGRCIPRFQDLEENDYIEEDRAWSFTMWLLRTRYVVSHAWLTAAHPDPQGVQLDSLMCELAKCNKWKFWKRITGCHDVVFFDYASLPQNGPNGQKRNDEEKELFNKALKGMNILYSHSSFQVLVIPDVPEGRQYKDRGWCYTELAISTAHGRVINDFWCSEVRRLIKQEEMPVFPNTFYRKFEGKDFTNKGDRTITMKIYSAYFKHVELQVTHPVRLVYLACVGLPVALLFAAYGQVVLLAITSHSDFRS